MRLAQRLSRVAPSATLTLAAKAKAMKAEGQDVVSLTAGEPDFPTAPHIIAAIHRSLDRGDTTYTAVPGVPELREAVAAHHSRDDVPFAAENVIVSTGAKQSLFGAMQCLLDPGDKGVVIAPYWLSYADMIRVAGGEVEIVQTDEGSDFLAAPDRLDAALAGARVLILNSPSNPSGAVYSAERMNAIASVLRKHPDVVIIADEIYDRFVYGDASYTSILDVAPDLAERILLINGCSKTYAMTGLRIGWAVGPKLLIGAMSRLQGQSTSNASAPMQAGALAAITGDQTPVEEMVRAFDVRRRFVVGRLQAIPGVTCFEPAGAFYVLPSLASYVGRTLPDGSPIDDTFPITAHLLHDHGLVVVPGGPFGAPNHIRLSFAADMENLTKGLDRLRDALVTFS